MATLTTVEMVKRQLGIVTYTDGTLSTNDVDDDIITDYVIEASKMFETETRRVFSSTSGATLTYDLAIPSVYGRKLFFGRDVISVDRVINGDGSVIPASAYRLLPVNNDPKYGLELLLGSTYFWLTSDNIWQNAITVNGTTGYCMTNEQPADVTLAVTKLAAHLYQTRDNTGEIQVADGFVVVPGDTPKTTLRTIANYRTVQIYVAPAG